MSRHNKKAYLPPQDWPKKDRAAWKWANRGGDVLYPDGAARKWTSTTHGKVVRAYGAFLLFLQKNDFLNEKSNPADRLIEPFLRPYYNFLLETKAHLAPQTIGKEFNHISMAVRVMDPDADRSVILGLINWLNQKFEPRIDKTGKILSPVKFIELSLKLMEDATQMTAHPKIKAAKYRDGLMFSLMALCPLRAGTFSKLKLNKHIVQTDGSIRIMIAAEEMKARRAVDVAFPRQILPFLEEYLKNHHPHLCNSPEKRNHLWLSTRGNPMSAMYIANVFRSHTEQHFQIPISPHRLRDSAATFMYETKPEQAALAAAVLQHKSFKVTEKHYISGDQRRAALKYQSVIQSLLRKYEQNLGEVLK